MTKFLSSCTLLRTTKLHKFYEHCVEIGKAGQEEKKGLKLKKRQTNRSSKVILSIHHFSM